MDTLTLTRWTNWCRVADTRVSLFIVKWTAWVGLIDYKVCHFLSGAALWSLMDTGWLVAWARPLAQCQVELGLLTVFACVWTIFAAISLDLMIVTCSNRTSLLLVLIISEAHELTINEYFIIEYFVSEVLLGNQQSKTPNWHTRYSSRHPWELAWTRHLVPLRRLNFEWKSQPCEFPHTIHQASYFHRK